MKVLSSLMILTSVLSCQFACSAFSPQVHEDASSAVDLSVDQQIADLPDLKIRAIEDPVHGGQIRWVEVGHSLADAPPLLLVHGLGSAGMRDFYPLLDELSLKHRVLMLDLPGFARSSKANLHYRPASYAALLAKLIESEAGGKVDLLGHSMGAAALVELAGRHPHLVRRLILMDAPAILHREALVASYIPKKILGTARIFLESYRFLEPDLSQYLKSTESRKQKLSGDPKRIVLLSFVMHNFGPALSGIEAPTLILWGREDKIAPMRNGHLLHSRIPNSRLVILEGVKHEPQIEAPKRVLAEVLAHLDNKTPDYDKTDRNEDQQTLRCARCDGQEDVVYEGDFDSIEISNCESVLLKQVRANKILVESSLVKMQNTRVVSDPKSPGPALLVKDSMLIITGGLFEGQPALRLEGSTADIAGARLRASQAPAWESDDSRTLFSVTEVRVGDSVEHLHEEH